MDEIRWRLHNIGYCLEQWRRRNQVVSTSYFGRPKDLYVRCWRRYDVYGRILVIETIWNRFESSADSFNESDHTSAGVSINMQKHKGVQCGMQANQDVHKEDNHDFGKDLGQEDIAKQLPS